MNTLFSLGFILFFSLMAGVPAGICSQNLKSVDPCGLATAEQLAAIFPTLLKAETQSVGKETVCNYLDKMGIPALVISVTKTGTGVHETLSVLGSGYVIEDIPRLGDEAAIAVQEANPQFGLQEGIAALHVKKGNRSLNFSFFRINLKADDREFDKIMRLAAEMIEKL